MKIIFSEPLIKLSQKQPFWGQFQQKTEMSVEEIKEIYNADKKRRVIIYRGDSGRYGYEQEYFSEDPFEMCWIQTGRAVAGFYDNAETAEREARGNIDWLKDLEDITD